MKRITVIILLLLGSALFAPTARAQETFVHYQSDGYDWPKDPAVLKKLDK